MGVSKKGRRKISVNNVDYIWYVDLDNDSPYYVLNIVSEDKTLILSCPLETETPYLISKGTVFQNKKSSGHWNRYLLPFDVPKIVTPSVVSEIIAWATQNADAEIIEWNGKNIPV